MRRKRDNKDGGDCCSGCGGGDEMTVTRAQRPLATQCSYSDMKSLLMLIMVAGSPSTPSLMVLALEWAALEWEGEEVR